jgi:hypothetical protein
MPRKPVVVPEGPFEPTWDSLLQYEVPQWYLDGKFGIFIHWGPYCVPAFGNEWYPRQMYQQGSREFEHHVKTYGPQSTTTGSRCTTRASRSGARPRWAPSETW